MGSLPDGLLVIDLTKAQGQKRGLRATKPAPRLNTAMQSRPGTRPPSASRELSAWFRVRVCPGQHLTIDRDLATMLGHKLWTFHFNTDPETSSSTTPFTQQPTTTETVIGFLRADAIAMFPKDYTLSHLSTM